MPPLQHLRPIIGQAARARYYSIRPPMRTPPPIQSRPRTFFLPRLLVSKSEAEPTPNASSALPPRSSRHSTYAAPPHHHYHLLPQTQAQTRPFSQTPRRPYAYDPNKWHHPHEDPQYKLARAQPLVTRSGLGRFVRSWTTRTVAAVAASAAVLFYFANMQTVPVSGRRRFNCFSEGFVAAVAEEQVKRIVWEVERQGGRFLGEGDMRTRMVRRVMARLIPVSGLGKGEGTEWEVRVIDDPRTANAFVLPGGKVFVYSGLFPLARNEDGLAAVLGHEIAHNLAEHVAERMSSSIGTDILLGSIILLTGGMAAVGTWALGNSALDLFFGKPMGRRQESEADYIGLMMMAEACYDPRQALGFWRRMERLHQQEEPPEWMSTHPSNHNRIQKITEWMPQALEKMEESDCRGTSDFADMFRKALDTGTIITSSGWVF